MPVDNETNRARVKASREALIARIGRDEYLRQENQKRKLRRERQRARTAPAPTPVSVPTPVPITSISAPVSSTASIRVPTTSVPFTPPTVAIERTVPVNTGFIAPTVTLEKTVPINVPTPEGKEEKEEKEEKEQKTDTCEALFEQVYEAKVKYYANLLIPRKKKRDSVFQQFKKIVNLHRKRFGTLIECSNLNFLKDTQKVIDFINTHWKTPNSRNSQIQAI